MIHPAPEKKHNVARKKLATKKYLGTRNGDYHARVAMQSYKQTWTK